VGKKAIIPINVELPRIPWQFNNFYGGYSPKRKNYRCSLYCVIMECLFAIWDYK